MQEVSMHSLGAEVHYHEMINCIENEQTRQTRFVWFHLTSFLAHAGMISKYISPIRPNGIKRERMALLKEKLSVSGASEVLTRNARDNAEHFDERIDNWVRDDAGSIMEIVLDSRSGYNYLIRDETRIKRVLLQEELIFISENRDGTKFELELKPLYDEVKRIGQNATEWLENSSPVHFIYPQ